MAFWFQFVFPNISYIESGHKETAMKKISANLMDSHVSYVYEDICLEKMWNLNAGDTWDFCFDKAGRWWDNNNEIDMVAIDSSGKDIIFGECKYWNKVVGTAVFNELEQKADKVDWMKSERRNHFILFSINGFSDELKELAKIRKDLILMS